VSLFATALLYGCTAERREARSPDARPVRPAVTAAAEQLAPPPARLELSGADLELELEIAALRLAQAKIGEELGKLRQNDAQAEADEAFKLAKRRLEVFRKFTKPQRVARMELDVAELRDELHSAELDGESADEDGGGGESVAESPPAGSQPDRRAGRSAELSGRAVERLRRELRLAEQELKTLREVLLPLEEMELDFVAEQLKHATLQAQRDYEIPLLEQRIAILRAEAEMKRLESVAGSRKTE
jgi:hypothetical protein